jgi:hypothetical protein
MLGLFLHGVLNCARASIWSAVVSVYHVLRWEGGDDGFNCLAAEAEVLNVNLLREFPVNHFCGDCGTDLVQHLAVVPLDQSLLLGGLFSQEGGTCVGVNDGGNQRFPQRTFGLSWVWLLGLTQPLSNLALREFSKTHF